MKTQLQQILLSCSRLPAGNREHTRCLQPLLAGLPQDGDLLRAACREGVGGLLYRHLRQSGLLEQRSEPFRKQIENDYYRIAADNLRLVADAKTVLETLEGRGIPTVVLQGMALLDRYADIGLRPMNDIDLWVMAADLPRADQSLTALGYRRDKLYPGSYRKGSTKIDLRTHLFWADRIHSRRYLLAVSQESIFRDAVGFRIDGCAARRLMPYDEMIYLSMHAIKHFAACLIWLVDLRLITAEWTETEWRQCLQRAAHLGQASIIACTLFLLRDLFGSAAVGYRGHPAGMPPLGILHKAVLKQRKKSGALPEWAPLLLFETNGGWKNRLLYQTENLFPRPAVLGQVFPADRSGNRWLLYGLRFLQLYGKAIRSFTTR